MTEKAPALDHKAFLASLPPEVSAGLTRTEDRAGLVHLAGHAGMIAVLGVLIALRVPLWPVLLPLQGIGLCFLFTLQHEATHKTPFASGALNEWVGRLSGFLILQPFEWFRYFHLAHHRYTNIPDRDPELMSGAKPETRAALALYVSGLPYWTGMARVIAQNASGRASGSYLPTRALPRIVREARGMVLGYALVASSLLWSPVLLWVWIIPMLLGQPFLRLYLLAEHGRCPFVANMFENTRTTYTTMVVRFLAWNMPYHVEHHVYPAVPFHKLPEFHDLMRDHLAVTAPGYVAFTRSYLDEL